MRPPLSLPAPERWELTAAEFIQEVRREREKGFGFVPLIGAGLAAPSGIPLIREIAAYLQRCIAMSLGLNVDAVQTWTKEQAGSTDISASDEWPDCRIWNPRRDAWPPFGDLHLANRDTTDWSERLHRVVIALHGAPLRPNEYHIFREAWGAMSEWRSSLHFLTRIALVSDGDGGAGDRGRRLQLLSPEPDVVDRFFRHVVLGKRPTLGHRMLALLGDVLRCKVYLTTNFDDLSERAFDEIGKTLSPLEVHESTGLPSFPLLSPQPVIIKLHGGRHRLRADYSLDDMPDESDLRNMVSYFAEHAIQAPLGHTGSSRPGSSRGASQQLHFPRGQGPVRTRNHLLVMGISGAEMRLNRLIEAAWLSLNADFRIFWICHTQSDVERIRHLRRRFLRGSNRAEDRFVVVRCPFLDLLFLEMFQHVTEGLPRAGLPFPSVPRLAVPVDRRPVRRVAAGKASRDPQEVFDEKRRELTRHVDRLVRSTYLVRQPSPVADRLIVFHSDPKTHGVMSIAAEEFLDRLDTGTQCIWLDLDEIDSSDDLFEQILHAVARKAGVVDWMPLLLRDDAAYRTREIQRITNNPNRPWVIFLNARDGAGANWQRGSETNSEPNGWLDRAYWGEEPAGPDDDRSAATAPFLELCRQLCGADCPNVVVVLLCRSFAQGGASGSGQPRLVKALMQDTEVRKRLQATFVAQEQSCTDFPGTVKAFLEAAEQWIQDGAHSANEADTETARRRFLYALTVVERPRYPAQLWSWSFHLRDRPGPSSGAPVKLSRERYTLTDVWIADLKSRSLLRQKPGGFIWMHCKHRDALRGHLEQHEDIARRRMKITHGIAEWYRKLFFASEDALAAFEAVYHRCNNAAAAIDRIRQPIPGDEKRGPELKRLCWMRARNALRDARAMLRLAKTPALSAGFSKGYCRRLVHLRDRLTATVENPSIDLLKTNSLSADELIALLDECRNVKLATLRLKRDLARECAENLTAIQRLQQQAQEYTRPYFPSSPETNDGPFGWKRWPFLFMRRSDDDGAAFPLEYLRELGTLFLATRSYSRAETCFRYAYRRYGFPFKQLSGLGQSPDPATAESKEREFVTASIEWARLVDKGETPGNAGPIPDKRFCDAQMIWEVRHGIVKLLQRHMQMFLLRGHALHLRSRRPDPPDEPETDFRSAIGCYRAAIEILRFIEERRVRSTDELQPILDDRQRLETQYALALAFLGDYDKACQRLNEAASCLKHSGASYHSMQSAIIHLHRAEIFTHQAVFRAESDSVRMSIVGTNRRELLNLLWQRSPLRNLADCVNNQRNRLQGQQQPLRQSTAFLDDAWQALASGEELLESNRKNVWWVTWFFELRLKVIELKLFTSLWTGQGTIPFCDAESMPRGFPSVPERTLDNALRMVRLDVYRLARIVESFVNCLFAVSLHVVLDGRAGMTASAGSGGDSGVLRQRQASMRKQAEKAIGELRERFDRKENWQEFEGSRLDATVKGYVEWVIDEHGRILDLLDDEKFLKIVPLLGDPNVSI